jgi:hypothetical protein
MKIWQFCLRISKNRRKVIIIEKLIRLRILLMSTFVICLHVICLLYDSCFCCCLTWVVRFANFTDPFHEWDCQLYIYIRTHTIYIHIDSTETDSVFWCPGQSPVVGRPYNRPYILILQNLISGSHNSTHPIWVTKLFLKLYPAVCLNLSNKAGIKKIGANKQ